jgi:hypothetical protein
MPTSLYCEEIHLVNTINRIGNEFIPKVFKHLKDYKGVVFDFARKEFTAEFNQYVLLFTTPESDEVFFRWSVDETYKNALNFGIITNNPSYKRSPFIITMGYVLADGSFTKTTCNSTILKNPELKTDFDANFLRIHHPNNDKNSLEYKFEDALTYHSGIVDFSSGIPKVYNHYNHFSDSELIDAATQDMRQNADQILKNLEEKIQKHEKWIDFLGETIPRIVNITAKE